MTDKSPQVYKDDPIHRIAAELSRADSSSNAKSHSTSNQFREGPLAGALFRRPRPHHRSRVRPRRSVLDEEYFSGPPPRSSSLWSSSSWKQRRKPAAEKRSYSGHQGGGFLYPSSSPFSTL